MNRIHIEENMLTIIQKDVVFELVALWPEGSETNIKVIKHVLKDVKGFDVPQFVEDKSFIVDNFEFENMSIWASTYEDEETQENIVSWFIDRE